MTSEYFDAYAELEVHRIMLTDSMRVNAYKHAIFKNKDLFENKKVLDLGAGTGLLSVMCSQAGASKVYAVEASRDMIPILNGTITENNCSDTIEIIEGEIEHINLKENVDIIISEWMGFYLFHEGMIRSVLTAKDRFLTDGGIILPETCELYTALCSFSDHIDFFENVHGIKMTYAGHFLLNHCEPRPKITTMNNNSLISEPKLVCRLNIINTKQSQVGKIMKAMEFEALDDCECNGLCLWFDVYFQGETFSTSPASPKTHWEQTLILFDERYILKKGQSVSLQLIIEEKERRKYNISVNSVECK